MVNISMLIASTIRLMFDLSVSRVPRPCLYILGSSSQPKCFACVNLAYTRCMRTLESITPDHHVVLRNNEPSQRCIVRGTLSWNFSEGSSYLCYRRSKQIRSKYETPHANHKMTWYGQYHLAPLISIFEARHDHHHHQHDTMISITMISIIVSSWSCLANYYFYYYG